MLKLLQFTFLISPFFFLLHCIMYFAKIILSKVHNRPSSACPNVHVSLSYNRTGLSGDLFIPQNVRYCGVNS